jgi:glycosyltransferase involved in cell wall biosynthesis
MITIIIPLYNKEASIATALRGVLAQTYQDFEVVVVDDGSTDGGAAVVETFDDPRIRLIRQANGGVSAARNRGIAEARGEHVAFLDADDEWMPEFLEEIAALIAAYPESKARATNYIFNSNGVKSPTLLRKIPFTEERGVMTNYFEIASCSHPPVCSICVCIDRDLLQEIGGFPVGIKSGEDLLTWARIAVRTLWAYSMKPLAQFNVEGYDMKDRPKRIPAEVDVVGDELKLMWKKSPKIKGMKRYIAHWHKMRCSIYMRLGMKRKSINEALRGLKYHPLNYKLYAYILLNIIPIRSVNK